jgi:hypothetical protein
LGPGFAGAVFPVLAGACEVRVEPGAERSADVGPDVVADRRRRAGIQSDGGEHLLEELCGGFVDHVRVAASGRLDRGEERADVEREPVGARPLAILLQRDQLGAVDHLAAGVAEYVVARARIRDLRWSPRRASRSISSARTSSSIVRAIADRQAA